MTRAWDKEIFESPPEHMAGALSTELEQGHLTEFMYDRRPAYC